MASPVEAMAASASLPWWLLGAALPLAVGALAWGLRQRRRARRLEADGLRLQALMANMPGALITADETGRIESFNPAAEELFGYRTEEVIGANVRILMPEPERSRHDDYLRRYLETGEARVLGIPAYEVTGLHKDGRHLPLRMTLSEVRLPDRRQFVSILRDFGPQKALAEELERASGFANAVINSLPGMFYLLDREGRCHRWNRNLETVTGYTGEEITAMRPAHYFPEADRDRIAEAVATAFREGEVTVEADLLTKDGRTVPHLWTGFRVDLDGEAYMAGVGIDITQRKALEEELTQRATTDPLTGVPNRLHFEQHLEREIAKAERSGQPLALIMADLDHFKAVNDEHGHEVGDAVLRTAVEAVDPLLRGGDLLARWGGEEFMVLAADTDQTGARELAERLRQTLEAHPFPGDGEHLTASFGVAEYLPGETQGALVRRADAGLYRAKRFGRNRVEAGPRIPEPGPASGGG